MGALTRRSEFPYARNSLNLLRLTLAAMVLFAHSFYLTGRGSGPSLQHDNLGGWAVAGFFVISGFLITRSRLRTDLRTYLVHRVARIYPGFVVCLLVTVLVLAPVTTLLEHGSLGGYLTTAPGPLHYVTANLGLRIDQYGIGSTLDAVPYRGAWNGSLWSLYFEFLCYLALAVLGCWSRFRTSTAVVAGLFLASTLAWAACQQVELPWDLLMLARLMPFFLGGSLAHHVVRRWGLTHAGGLVAIVLSAGLVATVPTLGGQLAAPLLGYGLVYLATVVPQPGWIGRHDVSYGFYIYNWPVQQVAVVLGATSLGLASYLVTVASATCAVAALSWFLVERPVLDAVRRRRASPASGSRAALRVRGAAASRRQPAPAPQR